jgi:hypothetical protein
VAVSSAEGGFWLAAMATSRASIHWRLLYT